MSFQDQYKNIIEENNTNEGKEKVLEVKDLTISFKTDNGKVQAVRGVSFDLYKGETLCIVGESGSGKSVTSKAIMGILSANALVEGGQIIYQGEDLLKVSENEFHRIRGHKIGMIFQDPLSSLNPIVKIGKQITETMMINKDQLKNRYNELIAPQLTAYKNNKVIRATSMTYAESDYEHICHNEDDKIQDAKKKTEAAKAHVESLKDSTDVKLKTEAEEELKELTEKEQEITKASEAIKNQAKADCEKKKADADLLYKESKPKLKAALKEAKIKAKADNATYKAGLEKKRDEDLKVVRAKKALVKIDDQAVAAIDKQIKEVKIKYYLDYFKTKKHLRHQLAADRDTKIAELLAKRKEITKPLDEVNGEEEEIIRNYQNAVKITKAEAKRQALEVMREVGIPQPEKRYYQYPFQFSGGMRQRIVIAIALTAAPDILICDEPTTALDVTIQAQILELINNLKATRHLSCIFITHDLGVVANMADRVAVMYAGKICEYGTDKEIFFDPRHPYTWALLSSIPDIDSKEKLEAIPGTPPDMIYPPLGDAFAQRNRYAMGVDFKYQPPFFKITETHYAATWLLYPGAPEVEMPKIVSTRIKKALEEESSYAAKR
ncbi:MAG: ATP-binding cassette domain-containing protein [Bacilli bacterium]|jgi:oligopeptide transport system ATP-binding protein|nr:ATP-binding cassette domain-containing protein [Bacilli bacterium]